MKREIRSFWKEKGFKIKKTKNKHGYLVVWEVCDPNGNHCRMVAIQQKFLGKMEKRYFFLEDNLRSYLSRSEEEALLFIRKAKLLAFD